MAKIIDISTRKEKSDEKLIKYFAPPQNRTLERENHAKFKSPIFLSIFVSAVVFSLLIWFVFVKTAIWKDIASPIIGSIPVEQKQNKDKFVVLNKRNNKIEIRTNKERTDIDKSKYSEEITSWVDKEGKMHFSNAK